MQYTNNGQLVQFPTRQLVEKITGDREQLQITVIKSKLLGDDELRAFLNETLICANEFIIREARRGHRTARVPIPHEHVRALGQHQIESLMYLMQDETHFSISLEQTYRPHVALGEALWYFEFSW